MFKINFIILILSVIFYSTSGNLAGLGLFEDKAEESKPYCFQLSWLGPTFGEKDKKNCSDTNFDHIPCIEPFKRSTTFPNFTEIWYSEDREQYTCALYPGYSCIKYSYIFNGAILNSSHFCGKMDQDKVTVIEKGCYTQKFEGHIIETCACQTKGLKNEIPCNSSIINRSTLLGLTLILLLVLFKEYL